jgi:hypothetical protein
MAQKATVVIREMRSMRIAQGGKLCKCRGAKQEND